MKKFNTNTERVKMSCYRALPIEHKRDILKGMIYRFATKIDRYEVAYMEPYGLGFKCILPKYSPLFEGDRSIHSEAYWKKWFKDNNMIKDVPGRYIYISSTGNGLVFKKIKIDLTNFLNN